MKYFSKKKLSIIKELYDLEPQFVSFGLFYGFPECCIASFIHNPFYRRPWYVDGPYTGTGYIPCKDCITPATLQWEKVKKKIQRNRIAKETFPEDPFVMESTVFFITLNNMLGADLEKALEKTNDTIYKQTNKILKNKGKYKNIFEYVESRFTLYKNNQIS